MSLRLAVASILLGAAAMTQPVAAQIPANVDPDFRAFLQQWEQATIGMINGDSAAWMAGISRDPSLFPWWGGIKRGRDAVMKQYRFAASKMTPGHTTSFEYLQVFVSGDLATTVAIERTRDVGTPPDSPPIKGTRVTHIFRKENGEWKLVHRHMDHLPLDAQGPPP